MVDWVSLPPEITSLIAAKIDAIEDYLAFGAVCKEWRSVSREEAKKILDPIWCMFPDLEQKHRPGDADRYSTERSFYSFSRGKAFTLDLPEIRGKRCWGTPYGWLIIHGEDLEIQLFHPLSRASIPLPSQRTFPGHEYNTNPLFSRPYYVSRALLTASPLHDWTVFVIYRSSNLGFAKSGDRVWSPIDNFYCCDITLCNGVLYGCRWEGEIRTFDFSAAARPVAVDFAPPPENIVDPCAFHFYNFPSFYIVDLEGELCLVVRRFKTEKRLLSKRKRCDDDEYRGYYEMRDFEIYRLDLLTKKWTRLYSMGNWCVLVSLSQSFSVDGSKDRELSPNCIYFNEDYESLHYYRRRPKFG